MDLSATIIALGYLIIFGYGGGFYVRHRKNHVPQGRVAVAAGMALAVIPQIAFYAPRAFGYESRSDEWVVMSRFSHFAMISFLAFTLWILHEYRRAP